MKFKIKVDPDLSVVAGLILFVLSFISSRATISCDLAALSQDGHKQNQIYEASFKGSYTFKITAHEQRGGANV